MSKEKAHLLNQSEVASLYRVMTDDLFAFFYSLTRDSETSEDLMHDLFLKLLADSNESRLLNLNIRSYIFSAGYMIFLDHSKSTHSRKKRELRYADSDLRKGNHSEPVNEDFTKKNPADIILDLMHLPGRLILSEAHRSLVHYRLFTALDNSEIAEILGLSRRTFYRESEKCFRLIKDALRREGYNAEEFL
jgi:RNA polymerase sigma factor (sigma-70 family)